MKGKAKGKISAASTSKFNITLIRHARSKYNEAEFDPAYGGYANCMFHPELIDPPLTDFGIKQTHSAHEKMKDKPYDFVFVSPLRRAMQTATVIFKDNPGNPKFIAVPMLSEMFHCAGDVGSDYKKVKETFKHVDFSYIDQMENPNYWYVEDLTNKKWSAETLEKVSKAFYNEEEGRAKAATFVLEIMKSMKKAPESQEDFAERIERAKDYIREFVKENGDDKKYALVAHGYFLQEFTSTGKYGGDWFDNCQIKHFPFDL